MRTKDKWARVFSPCFLFDAFIIVASSSIVIYTYGYVLDKVPITETETFRNILNISLGLFGGTLAQGIYGVLTQKENIRTNWAFLITSGILFIIIGYNYIIVLGDSPKPVESNTMHISPESLNEIKSSIHNERSKVEQTIMDNINKLQLNK